MCTAPKRHTTKAKATDRSDLQIDPAKYEKATTADDRQAQAKADKKARAAAAARHLDAATARFATNPERLIDDPDVLAMAVATITRAFDFQYQARDKALQLACQLAGADMIVDGPGSVTPDWSTTWKYFTTSANLAQLRTAVAAGSAAIALIAGGANEYSWNSDKYSAVLAWLMHTGYEPGDDELELIEAAFAARIEDHDALAGHVAEIRAAEPPPPAASAKAADILGDVDELDRLTARAADLDDGPELDQVNARIAELTGTGGNGADDEDA